MIRIALCIVGGVVHFCLQFGPRILIGKTNHCGVKQDHLTAFIHTILCSWTHLNTCLLTTWNCIVGFVHFFCLQFGPRVFVCVCQPVPHNKVHSFIMKLNSSIVIYVLRCATLYALLEMSTSNYCVPLRYDVSIAEFGAKSKLSSNHSRTRCWVE